MAWLETYFRILTSYREKQQQQQQFSFFCYHPMDSPANFRDLNPSLQGQRNRDYNTSQQQQPQIMLIQQHHHHHHHLLPVTETPTTRRSIATTRRTPDPLFAGTQGKKSRQFSNKPIGAAYTYNWVMWKTFGCGTCLRCAAGWFCLFFAVCGILFVLWLFGILWICVFFEGFCEIRS